MIVNEEYLGSGLLVVIKKQSSDITWDLGYVISHNFGKYYRLNN